MARFLSSVVLALLVWPTRGGKAPKKVSHHASIHDNLQKLVQLEKKHRKNQSGDTKTGADGPSAKKRKSPPRAASDHHEEPAFPDLTAAPHLLGTGGWRPVSEAYERRIHGTDFRPRCNIERLPAAVAYDPNWRPPKDRPVIFTNFTTQPNFVWPAQFRWTKQNLARQDSEALYDFFIKVETITEVLLGKFRLGLEAEAKAAGKEETGIKGTQYVEAYQKEHYVQRLPEYVKNVMSKYDDRDQDFIVGSNKTYGRVVHGELQKLWYVFDRSTRIPEALIADIRPPPFFSLPTDVWGDLKKGDLRYYQRTLKIDPYADWPTRQHHWGHSTLALGVSGTGAIFHKHGPAANTVLFGKKRWFVYDERYGEREEFKKWKVSQREGGVGFEPLWKLVPRKKEAGLAGWGEAEKKVTMEHWAVSENGYRHPDFQEFWKDVGWECTQEAGEMIWVPGGQMHAVLNYGETIAVILEHKGPFVADVCPREVNKKVKMYKKSDGPPGYDFGDDEEEETEL